MFKKITFRLAMFFVNLFFLFVIVSCSENETPSIEQEFVEKEVIVADFSNLVWSDEFDYEGRPETSKWHHQIYAPNNGSWHNGEVQHYLDHEDNTFVSDGTLKIKAIKKNYTTQGVTKEFTSARMNSKYSFKYGKIEVRAKLPSGAGTWPAIWTLGANIMNKAITLEVNLEV